jgi:NAD(P)-dependent dehydrogenase (short-subunit alcohol dehydrogenase family)
MNLNSWLNLTGKRVLITGGTRGIGEATTALFQKCGATVYATGRELRSDEVVINVNFSDELATSIFIKETLPLLDIDILINNAGINKISPFAEIATQDFEEIMQVNLYAPFAITRAVIPCMKEKKWGRIVNVSSIFGVISKEHRGAYSTSKFALSGMTKALAAEVSKFNILANCICPGFVDTALTDRILGAEGKSQLANMIPIERLAKPEEIAKVILFLASSENTYLTGQDIIVDGGYSIV